MDVQRNLEANVEKRTKDTYGPPMGKRLLVFMDDMNMPQVDEYGTQQPIALLKLLLEKGGMYDRGKELNLKQFRDIGFVAAMGKVRCLIRYHRDQGTKRNGEVDGCIFLVSDADISGKKSEFSQQEANLGSSNCLLGCSTTELQETRGAVCVGGYCQVEMSLL